MRVSFRRILHSVGDLICLYLGFSSFEAGVTWLVAGVCFSCNELSGEVVLHLVSRIAMTACAGVLLVIRD